MGLLHVALVAPRYHVGSFDDDAGYILTAKALLAGTGLTGHLPSGETLIGLYPPGYSALLAPLVWLWPHSFVPLRLLSVACFAGVFPLTWVWLGRHHVGRTLRMLALLLLALGPPFATYGSMVMAEAPFILVLLLLLLALDRWQPQSRVVTPAGVTAVVLAAGLVWLKQAGLGLVIGLVLWLVLSRSVTGRSPGGRLVRGRAKAALLAGGVVLTLVPVVAARLAAGVPLAGSRYSQELGGFYHGGLLKRLVDVVPHSAWHLLATAIPATLVPYLEPLPLNGHWSDVWIVVSWQVTLLAVVGAVAWARRQHDAAVAMTVAYVAESVLWPSVNERRAILVLPLLAAWYVTGGAVLWEALRRRATTRRGLVASRVGGWAFAAVLVVLPLVAQTPRDYLYGWGQTSSRFGGSRYVAVLRQLGRPSDVVETDYRMSTALFTGHATAWTAFLQAQGGACYGRGLPYKMNTDHAGFLLLGDVNKPAQMDNACLLSLASTGSWAVPILHTTRDDAYVFELVGPGTANPAVADVLAAAGPPHYSTSRAETSVTWSWPSPRRVTQLSVGQAADEFGPTKEVRLEVERPDGTWVTENAARSGVGDGAGRAPYLLADLGSGEDVKGVRVTVRGGPGSRGATITDVAALGPSTGSS